MITEYNSKEKIIKGNFNLSVLNDVDKLNFTEGEFKGVIGQ